MSKFGNKLQHTMQHIVPAQVQIVLGGLSFQKLHVDVRAVAVGGRAGALARLRQVLTAHLAFRRVPWWVLQIVVCWK